MHIKYICFYIIFLVFYVFHAYSTEYKNMSYYDTYIKNKIQLNNYESIERYNEINNSEKFTIGCVSKSIFAATVLLFSMDKDYYYLFNNKGLNITIGELLKNKLIYFNKQSRLTNSQKEKMDFIKLLLPTIDKKILNTKVYEILNHTSIFADDLNKYFLYLLSQKFLKLFPDETKQKFLIYTGIQFFSLIEKKEKKESRYSNMGFMYLGGIMSLLTEKKDFYEEESDRIFKPLGFENRIIRSDFLSSEEFKARFKDQNYYDTFLNKKLKLNIYDFFYTEMDTLNAGLITDLETAFNISKEISKMYMGFDNKLSNNLIIPNDYFYKYKTYYGKDEYDIDTYYSLGTTIYLLEDQIKIKMAGNVFGKRTIFYFIYKKKDKIINNILLKYDKNDYNSNPDIEILLTFQNNFLYEVFFQHINFITIGPDIEFYNILAKSLYDLYGNENTINTDLIEKLINKNPHILINCLKNQINKNIFKKFKDNNIKKNEFYHYSDIYIKKLKAFL